MSKPKGKYLWLDLETTGLDPQFERVLECAVVVTGADLVPVEGLAFSMVVKPYGLVGRRQESDPFVQDMHTRNGLWDECAASEHRTRHLETRIIDLIEAVDWQYCRKPVLAGSSIHFDRSFLAVHLPDVVVRLHHRMLDASALMLAARDVGMPRHPAANPTAHRAMPDVLASIGHVRRHYEFFRMGVGR